jgi:hypothetical protein
VGVRNALLRPHSAFATRVCVENSAADSSEWWFDQTLAVCFRRESFAYLMPYLPSWHSHATASQEPSFENDIVKAPDLIHSKLCERHAA